MNKRRALQLATMSPFVYVRALGRGVYYGNDYPAINLIVAERIFGWEWRRSAITGRRCIYDPRGHIPDWMAEKADGEEALVTDFDAVKAPAYSSDTGLAWKVLREVCIPQQGPSGMQGRMLAFYGQLKLRLDRDGLHRSNLRWPYAMTWVTPMQICLAALAVACERDLP